MKKFLVSIILFFFVNSIFSQIINFKQFGTKGYVKFGYYNPYLRGSYGLDNTSSIYANVFLGLKGVKVLGISIPSLGYPWEWDLFENNTPIIKETTLFEYKIN